jgi:hypothetical protein|tara:strand:+ start:2120 stop:2302 length:183 start_codon:yes stop_codon:yes gene_type:complete
MRPSEVEKIINFRNAMMQVYVSAGKGGRDKVWVGHELITVFKELLEHYDSLFSDNISKGE